MVERPPRGGHHVPGLRHSWRLTELSDVQPLIEALRAQAERAREDGRHDYSRIWIIADRVAEGTREMVT